MDSRLYKEGFVPGPFESLEGFQKRVLSTKELTADPSQLSLELGLSLEVFDTVSPSFLLLRSNKKLPFYYGGMTWVVELEDKTPVTILQLPLKKRFSYLSEAEIIAHERVHILRSMFKEPLFEEVIAYRTSKNPFRRYFGPLIQDPREVAVFFAALSLPIFASLFSPMQILYAFIPLCILSTYALIRLVFRQRTVAKALKRLSKEGPHTEETLQLLTDREIINLAKGDLTFLSKEGPRFDLIRGILGKGIDF